MEEAEAMNVLYCGFFTLTACGLCLQGHIDARRNSRAPGPLSTRGAKVAHLRGIIELQPTLSVIPSECEESRVLAKNSA